MHYCVKLAQCYLVLCDAVCWCASYQEGWWQHAGGAEGGGEDGKGVVESSLDSIHGEDALADVIGFGRVQA
jgi:hypothetical protein